MSINYPADPCLACSWTHEVPEGVNAIEISSQRQENRLVALAMWDVLLRQGRRVAAVATSDWHRGAAPIGTPSVRVWAADLSASAILEGIRAGRVIVLANESLLAPEVTVRARRTAATIGDEVRVVRGETIRIVFERFASTRGYLRLHLVAADGTPLAITNPIFVEISEP